MKLLDIPSLAEGVRHFPVVVGAPLKAKPAHVQGHMCFCHTDILLATLSCTVEHATLRQEEYHGAELEIILIIQVVFMVRSDQQEIIFAPTTDEAAFFVGSLALALVFINSNLLRMTSMM